MLPSALYALCLKDVYYSCIPCDMYDNVTCKCEWKFMGLSKVIWDYSIVKTIQIRPKTPSSTSKQSIFSVKSF